MSCTTLRWLEPSSCPSRPLTTDLLLTTPTHILTAHCSLLTTHHSRVHRVTHGQQSLVGQHSKAHRAVELARFVTAAAEARTHSQHIAQLGACRLEHEHAVVITVRQEKETRMLAQALRACEPFRLGGGGGGDGMHGAAAPALLRMLQQLARVETNTPDTSASASASASTAPAPVAPAAPAASASEAEPKTKGATAEGVRAKRQLQQLDENVPVAPSSKQLKPAEQAAQAESTSNYGAGGLPLDAKAVGKSVRAALRGHPELQTSTLKQLRVHLETKLGDLTEWKGEIKKVTQAFMQAKAQAEA